MRALRNLAAGAVFIAGATAGFDHALAIPLADPAAATATNPSLPVQKVQYVWGGQNYCFYPGGWNGPGWYWCGYAWRRGYGWGGGRGWNGWAWRGGGWHGGAYYGRGWHGGGWHAGGGRWHGGGRHAGHGGGRRR